MLYINRLNTRSGYVLSQTGKNFDAKWKRLEQKLILVRDADGFKTNF